MILKFRRTPNIAVHFCHCRVKRKAIKSQAYNKIYKIQIRTAKYITKCFGILDKNCATLVLSMILIHNMQNEFFWSVLVIS